MQNYKINFAARIRKQAGCNDTSGQTVSYILLFMSWINLFNHDKAVAIIRLCKGLWLNEISWIFQCSIICETTIWIYYGPSGLLHVNLQSLWINKGDRKTWLPSRNAIKSAQLHFAYKHSYFALLYLGILSVRYLSRLFPNFPTNLY